MAFLKKLAQFFTPPASRADYWLAVKCKRCGEVVRGRIDMNNELSIDYGEDGGVMTYHCRKVLIGEQRCFQTIEVMLKFDANRRLLERQVNGGEFVDEAGAG